jgi:2-succinyl-5-enolpyruvyl-6-hydroxy-3-cyclohexene-1-carboxylate synthase
MSHSTFNRRWAEVILEAVTRHQVRHVCIAPGSRSAPLTLAAAGHARLVCHTHFDERGLGHLALGLAKSTAEPVVIIVTSGTAVANLYPAIIEARLTGERLIVLSADRPPELIDCGANQAIEQAGLFASHAATLNLPRPTADIPARWLVSAIDSLLSQQASGAVQINCPFAEPLYGGDPAAFKSWHDELGKWWQEERPWLEHTSATLTPVNSAWPGWRQKRGVVIAGKMRAEEGVAVAAWASRLGWPLLADVQSQTGQPLPYASRWLSDPRAVKWLSGTEIVVQFGSHLVGKAILNWLSQCQPDEYWLVEAMPGRRDPAHLRAHRIQAEILPWLAAHPALERPEWCSGLRSLAADCAASCQPASGEADRAMAAEQALFCPPVSRGFGPAAEGVAPCQPALSEVGLAQRLPSLLPEGGVLFLGNSLTIRLVDTYAQLPAGYPVFANRGASGIDGLIATAAGVQRGGNRPLLAVVGDISALYDLNSLALLRHSPVPVVAIVINNHGGQIFSMLPAPEKERERYFSMPQQVDFSAAARLFGLAYYRPDEWQSLNNALIQGWQGGATLIELQVAEGEGARSLAQSWRGDAPPDEPQTKHADITRPPAEAGKAARK